MEKTYHIHVKFKTGKTFGQSFETFKQLKSAYDAWEQCASGVDELWWSKSYVYA